MSTIEGEKVYTPDDLLTMPDRKKYELVDGKLVELEMSMWSSYVAGVIFRIVSNFCVANKLGWVFPEGTSFQCFPDNPDRIRKPDTCFIRMDRLTPEQMQREGHGTVVPDLVVEVLSPNDVAYKVDRKVEEYLDAGAVVVWVVNPDTRTVKTFRSGNQFALYHEDSEITEEDLLPGFQCKVGDLFAAFPDEK